MEKVVDLKPSEPEKPEEREGPLVPEDLVEAWNEEVAAGGVLPAVRELSLTRRKKAEARLREHPEAAWWARVFENDTNCVKVFEGVYNRVSSARTSSVAAKSAGKELWPPEFRAGRSRTITLKHDDRAAARVEVRWRSAHGFAVMAVELGTVARGDSQERALGALVKLLDPELETVCDERGARLA